MDNMQTISITKDEDAFFLFVVKDGEVRLVNAKIEFDNPKRLLDAAEYAKSGIDGMILNRNNS